MSAELKSALTFAILVTRMPKQAQLERARTIDRRCRWIFPFVFAITTVAIFFR